MLLTPTVKVASLMPASDSRDEKDEESDNRREPNGLGFNLKVFF